jgi:hypothetical protein
VQAIDALVQASRADSEPEHMPVYNYFGADLPEMLGLDRGRFSARELVEIARKALRSSSGGGSVASPRGFLAVTSSRTSRTSSR